MNPTLSYSNQDEAFSLINKYFEGTDAIFSNLINFKAIRWEAEKLNESESVLSEQESMDLHLDLILNEGSASVTKYHRGLALGQNSILEKAKAFSKNPKKIDESLERFKKILKTRVITVLNEQSATLGGLGSSAMTGARSPILSGIGSADLQTRIKSAFDKAQAQTAASAKKTKAEAVATAQSDAEVDKALAGGEHSSSEGEGTWWDTLTSLWYALTEGGSAWGITHLVLDILGFIGDFFGGLGMIFDVLNAILYFYRGKWMLGTISLIAGIVIGGGDSLKLLKGFAGPAEKVMVTTIKKGEKEGAKSLLEVPAKQRGGVTKLLQFIAKNIAGVLGTASGILAKFFDGFIAKIAGYIPLIGKHLKNFFQSVGQFFSKYADNMKNFSKGITKLEKELAEGVIKEADKTLKVFHSSKGATMKIDSKTGIVTCTDKGGKVIGEFSAEVFTNPKIGKKYKNIFKARKENNVVEWYVKYNNSISKVGAKLTSDTATRLQKILGIPLRTVKRLIFVIGKHAIDLLTGMSWEEAGFTKEEVDYYGNAHLQKWIDDRITKEREESGATYLPALDLDASDKEVMDEITAYQNNYAKTFGQPQIINVIYDKYGNEEVEEDFKVFWEEVGKEREAELEKLTQEDREKDEAAKNKKETNESVSLKYIIPFSRFAHRS